MIIIFCYIFGGKNLFLTVFDVVFMCRLPLSFVFIASPTILHVIVRVAKIETKTLYCMCCSQNGPSYFNLSIWNGSAVKKKRFTLAQHVQCSFGWVPTEGSEKKIGRDKHNFFFSLLWLCTINWRWAECIKTTWKRKKNLVYHGIGGRLFNRPNVRTKFILVSFSFHMNLF